MSALHADAVRVLGEWTAPDEAQEQLRRAYLSHLLAHDDAMWRTCVPAHLTASLLVLDSTGTRVLLALHGKGGFWAQFGGHCEPGDSSLAAAALREGVEESGIAGLRLVGAERADRCLPVELDRHALSSAFGTCGEHLDVRYVAVAPAGAEPVASAESRDVRWFAVDALPPGAVEDIGRLVQRARAAQSAAASGAGAAASEVSEVSPLSVSEMPSPAVADTPSR